MIDEFKKCYIVLLILFFQISFMSHQESKQEQVFESDPKQNVTDTSKSIDLEIIDAKSVHSEKIQEQVHSKSVDHILAELKNGVVQGKTEAKILLDSGRGYAVAEYLKNFHGLDHCEIAMQMIESDRGEFVLQHFKLFQGVNHTQIAIKLIETGKKQLVFDYIHNFDAESHIEIILKLVDLKMFVPTYFEKFKELNCFELAQRLINSGNGQLVAYNLEKFVELNSMELVVSLIAAGKGFDVGKSIGKFHVSEHRKIAEMLLNSDAAHAVAVFLSQFQGLDHTEIAMKLIDLGKALHVILSIDMFQGINHIEIASKIINSGKFDFGIDLFSNFPAVFHTQIVQKLCEVGKDKAVFDCLRYDFQGLNHSEMALWLIEKGKINIFKTYASYFKGLDARVVYKLIEIGEGDMVFKSIKSFSGFNELELIYKFIELGKEEILVRHLRNFKKLDKNVALKLIELGKGEDIIPFIKDFQRLDGIEILYKVIESGKGVRVINYLNAFDGFCHSEIALRLIDAGFCKAVAKYLKYFDTLNAQVAIKLIEMGEGWNVHINMNMFHKKDHSQILLKQIRSKNTGLRINHFLVSSSDFTALEFNHELAIALVDRNEARYVIENFEKFAYLDYSELAQKMIENQAGETLASGIKKFDGLDHRELAQKILYTKEAGSVAKWLFHFDSLDHRDVAFKLIESGFGKDVIQYFSNFNVADHSAIVTKLIELSDEDINFQLIQNPQILKTIESRETIKNLFNSIKAGRFVVQDLDRYRDIDIELIWKSFVSFFPEGITMSEVDQLRHLPTIEISAKILFELYMLKEKYPELNHSLHTRPILESLGIGSFRYLNLSRGLDLPLGFIVQLVHKEKKQAYTILHDLVKPLKRAYRLNFQDIQEQEIFFAYINSVKLHSPRIYARYRSIMLQSEEAIRTQQLLDFSHKVQLVHNTLVCGEFPQIELAQEEHELLKDLFDHVFPDMWAVNSDDDYDYDYYEDSYDEDNDGEEDEDNEENS